METGGGDALIRDFISKCSTDFHEQLSQFIVSTQVVVDKLDLKFYRLDETTGSFWTYLYMTGYFNVDETSHNKYTMSFPNNEIKTLFMRQLAEWKWNTYKEQFSRTQEAANRVMIH